MFPTLKLFQTLPCPEKPHCTRAHCLFSHSADITHIPVTPVPVDVPKPAPSAPSTPAKRTTAAAAVASTSIPAKRPISSPLRAAGPSNGTSSGEPPKKLQRTGTSQRPVAVPSGPQTTSVSLYVPLHSSVIHPCVEQTGVPVLRVSAAQSQVAIPVRQVRTAAGLRATAL